MAPTFSLLYAITNEKAVNLTQIDRITAAFRASPQKHVKITLLGILYFSIIYLETKISWFHVPTYYVPTLEVIRHCRETQQKWLSNRAVTS